MIDPFDSFNDELQKIAFLGELWGKVVDFFSPDNDKQERRVNYFFSDKAGPDKWEKFSKNVKSPEFLKQFLLHDKVDDKLQMHAKALHSLANGEVVGKVYSESKPGLSYEIKKMSEGNLGCTCNDWKFKGSLIPGYKCKHIKAFESGKSKIGYNFNALIARRIWNNILSKDSVSGRDKFNRPDFKRGML